MMHALAAGPAYSSYPGSGQISIVQVSNGWLVTTPFIHPDPNEMMFARQEAFMNKAIKMKEEQEDPVMAKIRQQQGESESDATNGFRGPRLPKVHELKEPNVSIFKTFPEVLEFLADLMKDWKPADQNQKT